MKGKRIALFLSRIHEKKGCDLLITAFAQVANAYPDLQLVMAGPDQAGWKRELECQAEVAGIGERVTWTGMLEGDLKWGAFHAADVFCLPSHQENFGIVVAEALACGKPALISNKVNIWREIETGGAGIVRDDTASGTADALRTWLNMSASAQEEMRAAARRCFESKFQIARAADDLLRVMGSFVK